MDDTRVLLNGLKQYQESLKKQCHCLNIEFQQLESRWNSFNHAAEGDYINLFRSGWEKTCGRFREYINQSQKILALLDDRIENLSELNSADSEVPRGGYNISSGGIISSASTATFLGSSSGKKIKGNSTKLRKNMGDVIDNKISTTDKFYPNGKYQAHHIIPGASANQSSLMRAAIDIAEFDIDSAINGIYLPEEDIQRALIQELTGISLPQHLGSHPTYTKLVDDILDEHWAEIVGTSKSEDSQEILNIVNRAIETLKGLIAGGILDVKNP